MKQLLGIIFIGVMCMPAFSQTGSLKNDRDSVSYSMGLLMGTSIQKAGITEINDQVFLQGIKDMVYGTPQIISPDQANMIMNTYLMKLVAKKASDNLLKGQQFLAENAQKEGVITLPSGLQYKVIKAGEGPSPVDTSMVTVHYTGTFIDGKVFDSSVDRGEPAEFGVGDVIPGWTEALKLMNAGANWMVYIPANLAYGENSPASIEPNSVMIFDIHLLSFK
ncbi:MAG: FKBP-type peptidyl-prolyl cis-trans isomerase [Bacteroidales bacterium]|nr:FKBP-type peptidyl-prolyl cis-trans isomerase [Bacteroidales bacterium]